MADPAEAAPAAPEAQDEESRPKAECPFCVMMRRGGCEVPFKVRQRRAAAGAARVLHLQRRARAGPRLAARMHVAVLLQPAN
jgi:hypothetical protein